MHVRSLPRPWKSFGHGVAYTVVGAVFVLVGLATARHGGGVVSLVGVFWMGLGVLSLLKHADEYPTFVAAVKDIYPIWEQPEWKQ